jgi:triacylglycerol lipase
VRYYSVAGTFERRWSRPRWHLSARIVERAEGPCDGLVSQASARWGEDFEVWDGDHMNLINWPEALQPVARKDRLPDYARLLGRLRDGGM